MADNENKTLIPEFIIYLNGPRLSVEKAADIQEIIINEKVDAPSTFMISMSDMDRKWTDSDDLSEGSEIKIQLGYKDEVDELMYGEITAISPSYRKNSDDHVLIKGSNHLHRLVRAKKTRSFSNMTDNVIFNKIANEAGLHSDTEHIGVNHSFAVQRNQTDYEYLLSISKKYNCKLWSDNKCLYVKKIKENSGEDIILEWGKTLLEFYPQLDTSNLITEVETRGWDNKNRNTVIGKATINDITQKIGGKTLGAAIVKKNFGDCQMTFLDDNIFDQKSADSAALDIITHNSMSYISASGKTQGNNKIRAGNIMELKELGGRFSGKYYVDSVKHHFSAKLGYSTSFNLVRNCV